MGPSCICNHLHVFATMSPQDPGMANHVFRSFVHLISPANPRPGIQGGGAELAETKRGLRQGEGRATSEEVEL